VVPRKFVVAPCIFASTINVKGEKNCMVPVFWAGS
jgi:hypothetical protein